MLPFKPFIYIYDSFKVSAQDSPRRWTQGFPSAITWAGIAGPRDNTLRWLLVCPLGAWLLLDLLDWVDFPQPILFRALHNWVSSVTFTNKSGLSVALDWHCYFHYLSGSAVGRLPELVGGFAGSAVADYRIIICICIWQSTHSTATRWCEFCG
jgi:hypothetical protein